MRGARGFTLLEVLVALAVAAMVASLLVVALEQMRIVAFRLQEQQTILRQATTLESWFRQSVAHLVALPPRRGVQFAGDAATLKGYSLAPLAETQLPAVIEWRLQPGPEGVSLIYREGDALAWQMLTVLEAGAELRYLDRKGQLHERWPVAEGGLQLPEAVALIWRGERQLAPWFVALHSRRDTMPVYGND